MDVTRARFRIFEPGKKQVFARIGRRIQHPDPVLVQAIELVERPGLRRRSAPVSQEFPRPLPAGEINTGSMMAGCILAGYPHSHQLTGARLPETPNNPFVHLLVHRSEVFAQIA